MQLDLKSLVAKRIAILFDYFLLENTDDTAEIYSQDCLP